MVKNAPNVQFLGNVLDKTHLSSIRKVKPKKTASKKPSDFFFKLFSLYSESWYEQKHHCFF